MDYNEEDFLPLSGIQHFAFCRRQWALIHVESQWADNFRTVDGTLFHRNAHDAGFTQSRGDRLITRGMAVFSARLGVSGECDVVEFHRGERGIPLQNREGLWQPFPVEYKRGHKQEHDGDALQLCAQAMCLEEMLCVSVPEGALYYGETRRRTAVPFTQELRQAVRDMLDEMHRMYRRGYTPRVKPTKACGSCSLKDICLPKLMRTQSVARYLADAMEDPP